MVCLGNMCVDTEHKGDDDDDDDDDDDYYYYYYYYYYYKSTDTPQFCYNLILNRNTTQVLTHNNNLLIHSFNNSNYNEELALLTVTRKLHEGVIIMTCIWKVAAFSYNRDIDYPDWRLCNFSSIPTGK